VSDGFVRNGCEDIVVKALGQPEHPGRVCDVGRGVAIREYFGSKSHSTPSVISDAQLAALTKKITQGVLQSLNSQQNQNFPIYSPNTTQHVSTKGMSFYRRQIMKRMSEKSVNCILMEDVMWWHMLMCTT